LFGVNIDLDSLFCPLSPSFFSLHSAPILLFPSLSCSPFSIIPHSPFFLSLLREFPYPFYCLLYTFSILHQYLSPFSCLLSPSLNSSLFFSLLFLYPFPVLPPSLVCTQPPFFGFLLCHAPFSIIPPSPFSLSLLDESPSTFYCLLSPSLNCITLFFASVPFSLPCSPSFFSLHPTPLLLFRFPSCSLLHHPSFSLLSFPP
jgi:hypothetical protein